MRRLRVLIPLVLSVIAVIVALWRYDGVAVLKKYAGIVEEHAIDASVAAGVKLEALTVEGRVQSDPADLLAAVDLERGAPLLTVDMADARAALEKLPWVKRAQVERKFPDTLNIIIEEKRAFALWQHDGIYTLVDAEGNAIVDVAGQYGALPLIVGTGAPEAAAELFQRLKSQPQLAARILGAVYVGERRWNLLFDSLDEGVAVRMPSDDLPEALARLAVLDRDYKILERDLEFIDLRVPTQLIVRVRKAPGVDGVSTTPAVPLASGPKQNA